MDLGDGFLVRSVEILAAGHPAGPERRALAVGRRRKRAPVRHSLGNCMRGIREALHPQLRLVWLLLLVENHPHGAVQELLRVISSPGESSLNYGELAAACAWGLAQLGRDILPELRERFARAPEAVKDFLCQVLWHLGPKAHGCEAWLADYDSPWCRAVLYRLEGFGWKLLLQRRVWPLWIDRDSLAALAELAFSLEGDDRWYALRALLGWGPHFAEVEPLLKALARDQNAELAEGALLVAQYLGMGRFDTPLPGREVLAARLYFGEPAPASDETSLHTALRKFTQKPTVSGQYEIIQDFYYLELPLQLEVLEAVRGFGLPDHQSARALLDIVEFPHTAPIRVAAVHAYLTLGGKVAKFVTLLADPNLQVRQAAAQSLLKVADPESVLEHLEDPVVQAAFQQESHFFRALVRWDPLDFQRLEKRLRALGLTRVLENLKLESLKWSRFDHFTAVQRQVATALIHYHQRLPDELVEGVANGEVTSIHVVSLWTAYPPERQADRGLAQLWARSSDEDRPAVRRALADRGVAGWLAIAGLLGDPNPKIAECAAQELKNWLQVEHYAVPDWLQNCSAAPTLAEWLAPLFLPPYQPFQRQWAVALLPHLKHTKLRPSGSEGEEELRELVRSDPDVGPDVLLWLLRWDRTSGK